MRNHEAGAGDLSALRVCDRPAAIGFHRIKPPQPAGDLAGPAQTRARAEGMERQLETIIRESRSSGNVDGWIPAPPGTSHASENILRNEGAT